MDTLLQQAIRLAQGASISALVCCCLYLWSSISLANNPSEADTPSPATVEMPPQHLKQDALLRIYRSNLLKKTYQHVIYPDSAIDNHHEGDVVLKVLINRRGEVESVMFDSRAKYNSLNKAALRAVKRTKPYPPVPQHLEGENFEILMPIRFRLTS